GRGSATAVSVEVRGGAEKNLTRSSELAFAEVGPKRVDGRAISAGKIEAIIVNLVRSSYLHSEIPGSFDHLGIGVADERSQFRGSGEKRSGFHFDAAQTILDGQSQIEPALRLDHFSGANRRRGARNCATDICVFEI